MNSKNESTKENKKEEVIEKLEDKIKSKTENKEEKLKEKKKEDIKPIKKPNFWIFLNGENLRGFHITFVLMIIIPISTFFIIRNVLKKYNFSRNQQDVYGVIGMLVSVWTILVCYIIYYFREDCSAVFCKKKQQEKEKDKSD